MASRWRLIDSRLVDGHDNRIRPTRMMTFGRSLLCLMLMFHHSVVGQDAPLKHTSSQGVEFKPVPGTTVLMAVHETRVSDFEAFVADRSYDWGMQPHFEQGSDHPVVGVNLIDALAFCGWLTDKERKEGRLNQEQSYRLPTRQEWSAASGILSARNPEATGIPAADEMEIFPWGVEWPPPTGVANLAQREIPGFVDEYNFTAPVGSFKPTAEGIYDLAGNVWEWTQDRELRPGGGGTLRGGSWAYFKKETLTSGYLYEVPSDLRAPTFGFRLVYEDRRRTSQLRLLAAKQESEATAAIQAEIRRKREETEAELARMTKEKAEAKPAAFSIDTSSVKAAVRGQSYTNSVGLNMVATEEPRLLVCSTETTLSAAQSWAKSTRKALPVQPHFVTEQQHPVANFSWVEAQAFCTWLTDFERLRNLIPQTSRYRLPTDEEWSRLAGLTNEAGASPAARHLQNREHFIGGSWPPEAMTVNLDAPKIRGYQDRFPYVAPVGSMAPDAGALFDLAGNVSEWCEDSWPDQAGHRVIRGASWLTSDPTAALTSYRSSRQQDLGRYDVGFRLVLDFGN
jgi:formylglycine-generating enzyme required for sulfatase activity